MSRWQRKGYDTSAFACLATASQPASRQPTFFGRVAPYGTTNALLTPIESAAEVNANVFLETLELKAGNHVGQSAICCPISKTLIPYRLSRWRCCCSLLVEGPFLSG